MVEKLSYFFRVSAFVARLNLRWGVLCYWQED